MRNKKKFHHYLRNHVLVLRDKKVSKLHTVDNNQIWNNKKQLLFVCIIIRDNIGLKIILIS